MMAASAHSIIENEQIGYSQPGDIVLAKLAHVEKRELLERWLVIALREEASGDGRSTGMPELIRDAIRALESGDVEA